jgi:hypothetical protein
MGCLLRETKKGFFAKMMILTSVNSISSFARRGRLAKANLIMFNAVGFSCAGTFRYLSTNNVEKEGRVLK